jgi:hypothetical protein
MRSPGFSMSDGHPLPEGLGDAGAALWGSVVADVAEGLLLDARELHALHQAAVIEDQLAALDAAVVAEGVVTAGSKGQVRVNPAVSEARQLRLAQQRLLGSVELDEPRSRSPRSLSASRAAHTRWALEERRTGRVFGNG